MQHKLGLRLEATETKLKNVSRHSFVLVRMKLHQCCGRRQVKDRMEQLRLTLPHVPASINT